MTSCSKETVTSVKFGGLVSYIGYVPCTAVQYSVAYYFERLLKRLRTVSRIA